ncbi:MAG: ATP-binding protein [Sphaerochaetaceae bacterium]|nr:ATP-binding protein [Sphaerochaetaceae bacterium]
MYYNRTIEKAIKESAASFPCIAIYGSRQVGKTTTIRTIFGDSIRFVTLDDASDRSLAQTNPSLFLDTFGWPLVIDEIDKAPQLLEQMKIRIDNQKFESLKANKNCPLMYVVSGSNQFKLKSSISESLAGRVGILSMSSFSQAEKNKMQGSCFDPSIQVLLEKEKSSAVVPRSSKEVFEDIFQGGMPDIVTGNSQREIYFRSYVSTYLEKDVRQLIEASSEALFINFMNIVALRTAQQLNYDNISNSLGIDKKTCVRWLSILESSGVIVLLHPYLPNISNRVIKAPKLYFMDTGLCAYLCKWPDAQMLENCAMNGAFFETYVVSEIIKSFQNAGLDPKQSLFYYRDKDQKEVDVIIEKSDGIYPIEIKKSKNPTKATKNFDVLRKFGKEIKPGLVIDSCDHIRAINEKAFFCPVYMVSV